VLAVGSLTFGSAHGVRPHGLATLSHAWNENALIMHAVPIGSHGVTRPCAAASRLSLSRKTPT
jgi:hypothetical protein